MVPARSQGRIGNALKLQLSQVLEMSTNARECLAFGDLLTLVHITHIIVVHVARVLLTLRELEHVVTLALTD